MFYLCCHHLLSKWSSKHTTTVEKMDETEATDDFRGKEVAPIGKDWLHVEELTGFFAPTLRFNPVYLELDQTQGMIQYRGGKERMLLRNITHVIPLEDHNQNSQHWHDNQHEHQREHEHHSFYTTKGSKQPRWRLMLQDIHHFQEWVLAFPTRERFLYWTELLTKVLENLNSQAIIDDILTLNLELKNDEGCDHPNNQDDVETAAMSTVTRSMSTTHEGIRGIPSNQISSKIEKQSRDLYVPQIDDWIDIRVEQPTTHNHFPDAVVIVA